MVEILKVRSLDMVQLQACQPRTMSVFKKIPCGSSSRQRYTEISPFLQNSPIEGTFLEMQHQFKALALEGRATRHISLQVQRLSTPKTFPTDLFRANPFPVHQASTPSSLRRTTILQITSFLSTIFQTLTRTVSGDQESPLLSTIPINIVLLQKRQRSIALGVQMSPLFSIPPVLTTPPQT